MMKFVRKGWVEPPRHIKEEEGKEVLRTFRTSFGHLISKADDIQRECKDYLVNTAQPCGFSYRCNHAVPQGGVLFNDDDGYENLMPLSRLAASQLCTKLEVPVAYMQKCLKAHKYDLATDNMRHWLKDYRKDLFIRSYSGRVRGVLSSKYSVCDTPDILGVIRDAVDTDRYSLKSHMLNEERLHLRLVGRDLLPVKDEDLFPALFVDSSDVGRNMLTVRFGIYKQVCTNGLIVSKADGVLYQQKHIGVKPDEFHENLVASLKKVETISQTLSLRIDLARKMDYDFDTWGESGFQDFMEDIRKKTKLSEQGAEKVVDFMKHKYGHTRWGYVNALTEVAQEYTLERRLELEKLAGDILVA